MTLQRSNLLCRSRQHRQEPSQKPRPSANQQTQSTIASDVYTVIMCNQVSVRSVETNEQTGPWTNQLLSFLMMTHGSNNRVSVESKAEDNGQLSSRSAVQSDPWPWRACCTGDNFHPTVDSWCHRRPRSGGQWVRDLCRVLNGFGFFVISLLVSG